MRDTFIKLLAVAAMALATVPLRAVAGVQNTDEVATTTDVADQSESFANSSALLYGNPAPSSVGNLTAKPADTLASFSSNGPRVSVPLPEPSSQTSLYVLSGVVGLGFVVMRRRRLLN